MWSPQGCVSVETPCEATFLIQSIRWNTDGNSLALIGKDHFCVTYLQNQTNEDKHLTDENDKINQENDEQEEDEDNSS